MTNFVVDRRRITEKILSIIKPDYTEKDLKTELLKWWKNIRSNGGLLLTTYGDKQFISAGLEYYDLEFTGLDRLIYTYLQLDKYMLSPYYLHRQKNKKFFMRIYDGRIVVLINLHGSIENYINSLDIKRIDFAKSSHLL